MYEERIRDENDEKFYAMTRQKVGTSRETFYNVFRGKFLRGNQGLVHFSTFKKGTAKRLVHECVKKGKEVIAYL